MAQPEHLGPNSRSARAGGPVLIAPRALVPTKRREKRDWRWQIRNAITSAGALARALPLTEEELLGARRAEREGLPIGITPYYLSLFDTKDPRCPIRLQCVPTAKEEREVPGDLADPLGEVGARGRAAPRAALPRPRAPPRDRSLRRLLPLLHALAHGGRRRRRGLAGAPRARVRLPRGAPRGARRHRERRRSAGDGDRAPRPAARRAVRAVPSVETIRLATRVPVTLPMRITGELVRALRPHHPLWVMTHFNHPKELTRRPIAACARLADAGFPVMNQTVLLRRRERRRRRRSRRSSAASCARASAPITSSRRIPFAARATCARRSRAGVEIMEQLQGRLTGIALPKLICDTPGGMGKVPLVPDYVVARGEGRTVLRTFRGEQVEYVDPPEG